MLEALGIVELFNFIIFFLYISWLLLALQIHVLLKCLVFRILYHSIALS